MSKEVMIIPATEEHIDAICEISIVAWTAIHKEYAKCLGDEIHDATSGNWQEALCADITGVVREGRAFVSIYEGKVVGYCSYRLVEDIKMGVVGRNAVSPEARGLGIGTKQNDFIINKLREFGMVYATVHTGLDDGHAAARRAYEKAGFNKSVSSINYYMKL